MNWNKHFNLAGKHAFLGASQHSWLNYDDEKMVNVYNNFLAKERGTRIHALAAELIDLKIKLPKTNKTLNLYVNDGIGFKMKPEQILYYSDNCFGTADTISFRNNELRIHDLKTGESPVSMDQLLIYAALFCLEYHKKPSDIKCELRIYQLDEVKVMNPETPDIASVMDKIITFDKLIGQMKREEQSI